MRNVLLSLTCLAALGCASARSSGAGAGSSYDACMNAERRHEIEFHDRESRRFSDAFHEASEGRVKARAELELAETEEEKRAARARISDFEGSARVYYSSADEHYFESKRLSRECEESEV